MWQRVGEPGEKEVAGMEKVANLLTTSACPRGVQDFSTG